MADGSIRVAMWSGPRNISTAMMRSFGARADTAVTDEPLYAHYLLATGVDHPGRELVIERHDPDWRAVVRELCGPVPGGRAVWYQKHMAHHLLAGMDRGWTAGLRNAFLIRDPVEMLVSLRKVTPGAGLVDTGLERQVELFEAERARLGRVPPVVNARDVLLDPARTLGALCEALGIGFDPAMLAWAPGRRPTDGAWAPYWYGAVERSTGFEAWKPAPDGIGDDLARDLLSACRGLYERLDEHALGRG